MHAHATSPSRPARTLLALHALASAACGSQPATPADVLPCDAAGAGLDASIPPGGTLDFAIATLRTETTATTVDTASSRPHTGFNLDGLFSASRDDRGCNHTDYFSDLDPDQNQTAACTAAGCGGVDNQLPAYLSALNSVSGQRTEQQVQSSLARGEHLYVLRVEGIDDLWCDPAVELTVLAVFDADADCANNFAGTGSFVADARSFEGGDATRPRWHARAAILDGRLRTLEPFSAPILLPITPLNAPSNGRVVEFTGHAGQLRFDLAPAAGDARGNLGAWVEVGEVVSAWTQFEPQNATTIETIAASLVDIQLRGVCSDRATSPARFGGAGIGYGFALAAARVAGVASEPAPGTCGRAASDAGLGD